MLTPLVKEKLRNEKDLENISPSKLNQELNRILETERMIREYKELITKMQRDFYSKKNSPFKPMKKIF
jgi:hypothetical protein